MPYSNKAFVTAKWWHLGATGVLQPLSEDFLYRSPQCPPSASWRALATKTPWERKGHV